MKSKSFIIFMVALFIGTNVIAQKQLKLAKSTTTKSFEVSDYSKLDVASDFNVHVTLSSGKDAINVKANSNLMDYVQVYKEDNTLYLRLKKNMWFKGRMILDVDISTEMITDYTASSDAIITLNTPLKTNTVQIDCKGDATFNGTINVDTLTLNAKSDAEIKLSGSTKKMIANLKSDSTFKNRDFTVQDLKISLQGDSEAIITVTNTLDVIASGDSDLRYAGNPSKVKQSARGDSEIKALK